MILDEEGKPIKFSNKFTIELRYVDSDKAKS